MDRTPALPHRPSTAAPAAGRAPLLLALAAAAVAAVLSGCGLHRQQPPVSAPMRFFTEVRAILDVGRPSTAYFDMRERLAGMGPEVDAALVAMAYDAREKTLIRANAITLLAERQSPAALPVMRRVLLTEDTELLRSAAVLGLQRLAPEYPEAAGLIRSAVGDPARTVRLNALQALDIRDVIAIRRLLELETDREVRKIAAQLVALAESRGAPLARDRHGALRTVALEDEPVLVFRPWQVDSVAGAMVGDLRVEFSDAPALPLTPGAEAVSGVVPAFFSPDRRQVVYEADRAIHVADLETRETRRVGPGVAPRLVPFSDRFVFVREREGARRETPAGTRLEYTVLTGGFDGAVPEPIGTLRATVQPMRHGSYSPVRWMVVGETPGGFVLRGEGLEPFTLPAPETGAAIPEQGQQQEAGVP